MLKVKQYYKQAAITVDLNDPVAVEKLIMEISKKRELLKAKSQEVTDAATQEKIQQELDMLKKKQQELKARLAQLQAGR
jgi:predicted  nucleic acid-binding Zn-ribbon protein